MVIAEDIISKISIGLAISFDLFILIKFRSQLKKFTRKILILRDLCLIMTSLDLFIDSCKHKTEDECKD